MKRRIERERVSLEERDRHLKLGPGRVIHGRLTGDLSQLTKARRKGRMVTQISYSNPLQLNMAAIHPVQIATGALAATGDGFTQTFRHA